jgi:hypothetical protein
VGLVDCRTIVLAPGKAFPFQLDFLNALRGYGDFIVPKTRGLVKYILSRISTLRYLHEGCLLRNLRRRWGFYRVAHGCDRLEDVGVNSAWETHIQRNEVFALVASVLVRNEVRDTISSEGSFGS